VKNRDLEFQKAFGRHVKKLREEQEWSQSQLASVSKIDETQISRIENGAQSANLQTIKSIAIALGKYPYELFKFDFRFQFNTDFSLTTKKRNGQRQPQLF
jgi:transcriptional regulator with XRE-family HTH domain